MNKKLNSILLVLLLVVTTQLVLLGCSSRNKDLIESGNQIIKKIEEYKTVHQKLPESLREIGLEVTLEGPIFYEKIDSTKYTLWFGTTLGESIAYDSWKGVWE